MQSIFDVRLKCFLLKKSYCGFKMSLFSSIQNKLLKMVKLFKQMTFLRTGLARLLIKHFCIYVSDSTNNI